MDETRSKRTSLTAPLDVGDELDLAPPPLPPATDGGETMNPLDAFMEPDESIGDDDGGTVNPLDLLQANMSSDDDDNAHDLLFEHRSSSMAQQQPSSADRIDDGFKSVNGVRLNLEDAAEVEKYVSSELADFTVEVMQGSGLHDGIVIFTRTTACVRTESGVVFEADLKRCALKDASAPGVLQLKSGAQTVLISTSRPIVIQCCFQSFRKLLRAKR